ncbi:MAG: response regulator, partial [Okeania sp. SIO3B3]|nr:response regulator [Okeania sp. SIO3B3]
VLTLKLLEKLLTEEKYNVITAFNGQKGLEMIVSELPDIVILDVDMPDIDGFTIIRNIKSVKHLNHIPIIFISGFTNTDIVVEAFELGAADYITKPIKSSEVKARVKTHLSLKQYVQTLKETNIILEQTKSELVQAEKLISLGEFAAGIAHELNNPMNYLKNSIDSLHKDYNDLLSYHQFCSEILCQYDATSVKLLNDKKKNEFEIDIILDEVPALFYQIKQGIQRTTNIINSLMIYTKDEDLEIKECNINNCLEESIKLIDSLDEKQIRIVKNYTSLPKIKTSKEKLMMVFLNMIKNAIDSIQSKKEKVNKNYSGKISITTRIEKISNKSQVIISIKDNGEGIDEKNREKIFDFFFTTKKIGQGMGLGLSICHRIIHKLGGRIEVNTQKNKNCEFKVLIPI